MSYLDAHRAVAQFTAAGGGPPLPLLLATSGMAVTLDLYLRAAAARQGRAAAVRTLAFGTLHQTLVGGETLTDGTASADGKVSAEPEVFVLFPWDFVPEADWRSGFPTTTPDVAALRARAEETAALIARRRRARVLYVPAQLAPLLGWPPAVTALSGWLTGLAAGMGATILPADAFSLASYLDSGNPFASRHLETVADAVISAALGGGAVPEPKKVLVSDLDNTLWSGVIGEDGLDGIAFEPVGVGYRFFLYQSFLAKLKREGVLLAAVSRNDPEIALAPLRGGRMTLGEADFVCVLASYHAKSAQIAALASQLNLGLDAFVFVDDNPVELAEVGEQLPAVRSITFPNSPDAMPGFLTELAALFARPNITQEDAERTAMYRRRLEGLAPSEAHGSDLSAFLRGLGMTLNVYELTHGNRTRAVQLLNKTNQFNLNGRRIDDDELGGRLTAGGRLFAASLSDRSGSHGEILACVIDPDRVVRSLVMSCRVFQRRVEHAFMAWLASQDAAPVGLEYVATPRNEPARQFLADPAFAMPAGGDGLVEWDAAAFARAHAEDLGLFEIRTQQPAT